jgi:hypothetical protein
VSVSLGVCVSVSLFVCCASLFMFLSLSLVSCLLSLALCAYVYLHDLIIDFALNVIPLPPRRSLSSLLPPLFPLSFPFLQLSRPPSALPFGVSMAMKPHRTEGNLYAIRPHFSCTYPLIRRHSWHPRSLSKARKGWSLATPCKNMAWRPPSSSHLATNDCHQPRAKTGGR